MGYKVGYRFRLILYAEWQQWVVSSTNQYDCCALDKGSFWNFELGFLEVAVQAHIAILHTLNQAHSSVVF